MNDKIKQLLENAEQSDAIAINKWRIENREQLRKERKEKLKELIENDKTMTNNKQQTAVEWLQSIELERDLTLADWALAKEIESRQSHRYATFCLRCANENLPIIRFKDWIKLDGGNQ